MRRLHPEKLHVRFVPGTQRAELCLPRCYTLTHSDRTGELYLTIGPAHDAAQVSGWYTRVMRDEVLAEWQAGVGVPALHVHCHVSGGLVFGPAGWRDAIFSHELPLVLEAFRYGDRALYEARADLDEAPIWVHFRARQRRYSRAEEWGKPADYR